MGATLAALLWCLTRKEVLHTEAALLHDMADYLDPEEDMPRCDQCGRHLEHHHLREREGHAKAVGGAADTSSDDSLEEDASVISSTSSTFEPRHHHHLPPKAAAICGDSGKSRDNGGGIHVTTKRIAIQCCGCPGEVLARLTAAAKK